MLCPKRVARSLLMDVERSITFNPPLYLQRRIWALDIMRRENITDILDVGCGEGELLYTLCNPPPWLPSDPPPAVEKFKNLHPRHIRGLDISKTDLEVAVKDTSPPSPHVKETGMLFPHPSIRWEPLQVDIWKGGLENVNPEFVGIDCIVSSEVIEHLPEDILSKFAPVLLGAYHPRLFLVTTPSYTFNARFSPPELGSTEKIRQGGYLDPTGRTDRVFRHSDHKFEWTVEEFTEWCTEAAQEWGYTVQVKGIGKAIEVDEWGRDDELGFASQVALFTRVYGEEASKLRETAVPRALGTVGVCEHELLATHYHTPHACAGKPLKTKEIQEKVKAEMKRCDDSNLTIRELWNQDEIAIACGGQLDALLDAVRGSSELDLYVTQEDWQEEWRVELVGGVQGEKDLWSENAETEPLQSGPEVRFDDGWGFAEADKIWEPSVVSWGAASEVDPGWGWGSGAETGWGMTAEVVET